MASYSNTIIIPDNEESLNLKLTISRPRRYPRRDYRYQEFESMLGEVIDDIPIIPSLRKRKRTKTESSILDNVFKNVRNVVDDEIQRLRD
ncbi:hypothetical protein N7501_003391 [Penicillium viridicatum]|nr:hypothetical protein N7501_003391 [Penicillium viridicatum]